MFIQVNQKGFLSNKESYTIKSPTDLCNFTQNSFNIKLDKTGVTYVNIETEDVNLVRTCFCLYTAHEAFKVHTFIVISNLFNLSISTDQSIAVTYEKLFVHLMHDNGVSYLQLDFCNNDNECEHVVKRQLANHKDGQNESQSDCVFFYSEQQENLTSFTVLDELLSNCLNKKFVYKLEDYGTITPERWSKGSFLNCIQFVCLFGEAFRLNIDTEYTQQLYANLVAVYGKAEYLDKWSSLSHDEFWSVFRYQQADAIYDMEVTRMITENFENWKSVRTQTIEKLKEIVDRMNFHHKNINISKLSGSLAGLVGTGIGIIGLLTMPFTAGLSAPLVFSGLG